MPNEPELAIRTAGEADIEAILALVGVGLGAGSVPRSPAFWRWKHERSPFGPSPILLAESRGELVGLRAFLRWRLRAGSRDLDAVRAVDTVTHPDWRGRGVFSRLTLELAERERRRGTAFVFNTPNRASGPGYRKMGWRRAGSVSVQARALRPFALFRGPRRDGETAAPGLGHLPPVRELLELPWLGRFLDAVEAGRKDRRYRTPLSKEYLRWRYAEIPDIEYRALWSGEAEAAAALVVRGRERGRFREVMVSEVLAPAGPAGVRAAARLLRRLARQAAADYLATVSSPGTLERAAAARAGFLPVPGAGPALFVRELADTPELPDPARRGSWRLGLGLLEIF